MVERLRALAATPEGLVWLVTSAVIGLCVVAVYAAVFANFARAREGGAVAQRRRSVVATGTMSAFFVAYYLLIHYHVGVVPLRDLAALVGLSALGAALVVVGCVVNIAGRVRLGRNWANQATVYEEQTLVRSGVYGVVRHPLYASLIWMFVGAAIAYHSWAALAASLLVFVPAMAHRARQEEALLEQRFPEYRDYRRQVGMFFPRLRGGAL